MRLTSTDALIVVDVQNDFLPGGQLGVTDGDAIDAMQDLGAASISVTDLNTDE